MPLVKGLDKFGEFSSPSGDSLCRAAAGARKVSLGIPSASRLVCYICVD